MKAGLARKEWERGVDKKIIGSTGAAIIAALGVWAPATAQSVGAGIPNMGGSATSGGAPSRHIDLTASVEVRHDSNVARTSAAAAAARGLSQSDEKLMPNISINMGLPFGVHNFTLSGSAGYDFYRRNTRLNRERIQFASSLAMNLPVCDPTITGNFSRRQSDLGEIGALSGVGTTTVRNTETQKTIGGTLACGKDYGLRPTFSASYMDGKNSATQRQVTDRNVTTYSAGIGYVHPLIGDLLLFAQERDTRFPNQLLPNGSENGHRQRSYGGSFTRNIGARLQGTVQVTYTDLKSRQAGVSSFHGLNWGGDLTVQASPMLMVHGSVGRSIASSLAIDANYHVDTHYSLDASLAVSPLMNIQGGFTIAKRNFFGSQGAFSPGVPAANLLTNDRKSTFFGSIAYQFAPKLKFILEGAHETRNANGTFFDYNNNRVGLRAELAL